jgi:hypothetical protein
VGCALNRGNDRGVTPTARAGAVSASTSWRIRASCRRWRPTWCSPAGPGPPSSWRPESPSPSSVVRADHVVLHGLAEGPAAAPAARRDAGGEPPRRAVLCGRAASLADATFAIGSLSAPRPNLEETKKYFRALRKAQRDIETQPRRHLKYLTRERPQDVAALVDLRRFGPGERLVFEPYTRETYDVTQQWMRNGRYASRRHVCPARHSRFATPRTRRSEEPVTRHARVRPARHGRVRFYR